MKPDNEFRLAWLTDIHLNKMSHRERHTFYQTINAQNNDALAISGDIAEPDSISALLLELAHNCAIPIHFVLGNHDYHLELFSTVRQRINTLCQHNKQLHWLANGHRWLTKHTAVTGIDGWADGRHGDYINSPMHCGDHRMALDFKHFKLMGKHALLQKMQQTADSEAQRLTQQLSDTIETQRAKHIIVLTHFPPFAEVSYFEGKPSHPKHLPFYTSKACGDALMQFAQQHPSTHITALCGHTHSHAHARILPNLDVTVGAATYGQASIQKVIKMTLR